MNRTRHSLQNSAWGFIYRILHMVFPVLLRALIIREIGAAYVGVNGLFKSILSVLNLSELGFGTAIVYMMYKPIAEGDKKTIRTLMSLLRRVYRVVGLIMLVVGLSLIPFLRFLVKNDTGTDVNIYVLYGMYLFHTVMSYWMFSYRSTLFTAHQESVVNFKIMVFCGIVQYALQIAVLLFTKNYYLYILVLSLMIIPQNLLYLFVSKKKYPDLYCEGEPTKEQIQTITTKIKSLLGHRIGNTFIFSIDSIIISAFLGVTILTKYDNYNYIMTSVVTLMTVIVTSIMASIGNKIALDAPDQIYDLFKRLTFLWVGLVAWCSTCLVSLYQTFITIWVGQEFLFPEGIVICIALYFFVWQFREIGMVVKDAGGLWEADKWKPYIGMVLNLVLSILCVKITGSILGVLLPTMVVLLCLYYPWETRVLFKHLFHRSSREYVLLNLRFCLTALFSGAVTFLLCWALPFGGIGGLIVRAALCVLVMPALYALLNGNTKQFKGIVRLLKRQAGKVSRKLLKGSN